MAEVDTDAVKEVSVWDDLLWLTRGRMRAEESTWLRALLSACLGD
jgi:hypothetical protein